MHCFYFEVAFIHVQNDAIRTPLFWEIWLNNFFVIQPDFFIAFL